MSQKKKIGFIISGIMFAILLVGLIVLGVKKVPVLKYKYQVVKKENYTEIMDEADSKLKEDEKYYLSYIVLKNLFTPDNIYGNTVNELIKKGKSEMKKDGYTVEKFKEELNSFNDNMNKSISEMNDYTNTLSSETSEKRFDTITINGNK